MKPAYKPNSLAIKTPWLESEWHPDNTCRFWEATYGSNIKRKWVCIRKHVWPASPNSRVIRESGCPECYKMATASNSLAVKAPWLESEWHPDNKENFCDVPYSSNIDRKWLCIKGHSWEASPNNRTSKRATGCPWCPAISIIDKAPWLGPEWHPDNKLSPKDVSYSSNTPRKWLCVKGHAWDTPPSNRTRKRNPTGCPWCSGNLVSEANSLKTKAPWLESEWHPDNEESFENTAYGSDIKCKWRCLPHGHAYWASPGHRTHSKNPSGCPECVRRCSRSELSIFDSVLGKYSDTVGGQRGLLKHKRSELDIYVPSLHKAIEFDGTYWHSLPGCAERDARKNLQCAQAGIQLLRIPEADYEANPSGTIAKILQWLDAPTSTAI